MNNEEWENETRRRWILTAKYFKPKENQTIADFIQTANDVSKEESSP